MRNIKPKYTSVKNEFGKKFVTGLRRPEDKLIVELEGNKEWTLKATERNFAKAEERMQEQSVYQVKEILPALKTDATIDITAAVLCLGMCAVTQFVNLPIKEQIERVIHYITGVLTTIAIPCIAIDLSRIRDIVKYNLFFENRSMLNASVEESYNMLNGTSHRTQRAISKNKDEQAISVMNLDQISLHDLRTIRDNIEIQNDLQFELNDRIKRTHKKRK